MEIKINFNTEKLQQDLDELNKKMQEILAKSKEPSPADTDKSSQSN